MKTNFKILGTILFVFLCTFSFGQKRIAIYLQNASPTANVQYTKMTHLVHAFFNPTDNTGNMTDINGVPTNSPNAWFTTLNFTNMVNAARLANPSIKIIISTGGAPAPGDMGITTRLNTILANAAARTEMANDLAAFIQQYNLDGWDFDLEHPVTQAEKDNHQLFLSMMRTRLNSLEATLCKDLEISIALNGETDKFVVNPSGADYVNPGVDPYVDFYHLMTYDASYAAHNAINGSWPLNHSPLIHAQEAVRDFSNPPFNWSKGKMVVGIPFYGRNGAVTSTYATINAGNSATIYNADLSGGYNYNGCPTITSKVNFAKSEGLAGVLVWEGSQDLNNSTGFSLASCLYTAMGAPNAWEKTCCEKPNLGNDLLICNTPLPITLNANTTSAGSPTYSWNRISPSPLVINASGSVTQNISVANGAGTYVVTRTSGTCSRTDTIVISNAVLPTPNLGPNRTLCTMPYDLKLINATAFPPGTTFQWQFGGSNIAGETTTSLYASTPGNYSLVATLSGCGSTTGNVTITSPSVTPVNACRTTAGTLNLSVTGGTGPYTWFSGDVPDNTVVGTGASFTTPSLPLPSVTYYYVESAGSITTTTIGETAAVPTGFANNVTYPSSFTGIAMEFDVKAPVKLQSVSVFPWGGATYPFTFAIEIFNDQNYIVYTSPSTTYNSWPGAAAQVITLNVPLEIGKYRIRAVRSGGTNTPAFFHHNTSAFQYGTTQDLTITRQIGVIQYGPFYSWVIGDYNNCPRIAVKAEVAASCSPISLPISLTYFDVTKNKNEITLNWGVITNERNSIYSIERMVEHNKFIEIGSLQHHGNSNEFIQFTYDDKNAPNQYLYYRIVQLNQDGTNYYSDIKGIDNRSTSTIKLIPNPYTTETMVSLGEGNPQRMTLQIFDSQGRFVSSYEDVENNFLVGKELKSGFYFIQIITEESIQVLKLIKE